MTQYLVLLILFTLSAAAQSAFSLEDAWQMALEKNLSLQREKAVLQSTQKQVEIERSSLLPSLAVVAGLSYTSELPQLNLPVNLPGVSGLEVGVKDKYDVAIQASQALFTGFRNRSLLKAAHRGTEAAGLDVSARENQLLLEVGLSFSRLQLINNTQTTIREGLNRTRRQLEYMRRLLAADQLVPFDTLVAANRLLSLTLQLQRLEDDRAVQTQQFWDLIRGEGTPPNAFAEFLLPAADPGTLAACRERALQQRPEMGALAARRQAGEARLGAIRSALWPQVYGQAAWHYGRPGADMFSDQWMGYATAGVQVQWQLWDWGKTRNMARQNTLANRQIDLAGQELKDGIRQQVDAAYRRWQSGQKQLAIQEKIVAQEHLRRDLAQSRYREGQIDQLTLDDSESTLLEAELEAQRARIAVQQDLLQLMFATGDIGKLAK